MRTVSWTSAIASVTRTVSLEHQRALQQDVEARVSVVSEEAKGEGRREGGEVCPHIVLTTCCHFQHKDNNYSDYFVSIHNTILVTPHRCSE